MDLAIQSKDLDKATKMPHDREFFSWYLPVLDKKLAFMVMIFNLFVPGMGTFIAAINTFPSFKTFILFIVAFL